MAPSLATRFSLLCISVISLITLVSAQNDPAALVGTWSSGMGNVKTGPGFANPLDFSFTYPTTSGISYSFTSDPAGDRTGYFEEAQYRFEGNASRPHCITGVVIFQHGNYTLNSNGSITLNPIPSDGRIQVQDMCAKQSNIIQQFNQTTLFSAWAILPDSQRGQTLQLYRFDGAKLSPMYLISKTPEMLPVQPLTPNVTTGQRGMIYASTGYTFVAGLDMSGIFAVMLAALLSGLGIFM